jgi:hypothetical protein
MKNTAIAKAVELMGKEPLRELLERVFGSMSREMINKSIRQGFAPSDWYEVIEIATNHQITSEQLMNDCYLNKRNCKPKVVRQQAELFAHACQECLRRVGKHRQAS